jgi:hypothetical protein
MWQLNQIIKPGRMGSIMTMMMMICAAVTARPEGYSRHRTVPNLITHLFWTFAVMSTDTNCLLRGQLPGQVEFCRWKGEDSWAVLHDNNEDLAMFGAHYQGFFFWNSVVSR